jgi:biotin-[acetyl-CoA-carboxylase] ligase BirA-like protein
LLVIENASQYRGFLPGFLPENLLPDSLIREVSQLSPFDRQLSEAMLGDHWQFQPNFKAPEASRGDFWASWFLADSAGKSQYDVLRQVINDHRNIPGHVVCLALQGNGFHGQNQRGWLAEKGNIHLTMGLRCDLPASDIGLALTMLPAVAVVDALQKLGLPAQGENSAGIKWVNDILVDGKKLGGVLTSARSQDGRISSVVLGIGLNVAVAPKIDPTIFTPQVTCLDDHITLGDRGMENTLAAVLSAVAGRFEQLDSAGPDPLLAAYRRVSRVLGRLVEIHESGGGNGGVRKGRVTDILPDLSLLLSDDPRPVTDGRLVLVNCENAG